MTIPSPDLITAYGLTALAAWTLSWMMWMLGRPFLRQGMSQAVLSTALSGSAYLFFALQVWLDLPVLQLTAKTLVSIALAVFTIALQRFRQSSDSTRDASTVLIPLIASLAFAVLFLPKDVSAFNRMQTTVTMLQTAYLLTVLVNMRASTPGLGWILIVSAASLQFFSALLPVLGQDTPLHHAVLMWGVCLAMHGKLVLSAFGFLRMQHDRQTALETNEARLDSLTQLPNRTALFRELDRAMKDAHEKKRALAVMVLDIDNFQRFNHTHGHLAGDQVIRMVAKILQEQSRGKDIVARFGGEEFVFVLPGTDEHEALIMAQRLCRVIRNTPLQLASGDALHVAVSVGIHSCTPSSANQPWEPMIEQAVKAMNSAKRSGRDRIVISNTQAAAS